MEYDPTEDVGGSKRGRDLWIINASDEQPADDWSHTLQVMVVNALGHVEIEPVLVRELVSVSSVTHVRIATLGNVLSLAFSVVTFMDSLKVRLHEFLIENFPAL